MTQQDTLQKAIKKATANGWTEGVQYLDALMQVEERPDFSSHIYGAVIYNHDFARALWGEYNGQLDVSTYYIPAHAPYEEPESCEYWQYHLQLMVIADNPLIYLQEHM